MMAADRRLAGRD